MKTKNSIVITNVDSLLGYALAYRFLEDWNREDSVYNQLKSKTEFKLLCHERQGLQDLERLGGKIFEVQNFDEKELDSIMINVSYVMFIPEFSKKRVEEGEAIFKSAKKGNVEYITMFSYLGLADLKEVDPKYSDMKNLMQLNELEKSIKDCFVKNYCVVQCAMFNQFFYYFGPMIDDENKICLTIDEKKRIGTIDLADVVDAVYNLSDPSKVKPKQTFNNLAQLYVSNLKLKNTTLLQFTPRKNFSAKRLVREASIGLDLDEMTYQKIGSAQLFDYLKRMQNDNRFRERPYQQANEIIKENSELGADRPYTFPLSRYLNDNHIETLLEYMYLIDQNETKITDDLSKALDRELQDISRFFSRNRNQFRRLR